MALVDRLASEEIGSRLMRKLWSDTPANLQPLVDAALAEAAQKYPFELTDTVTFADDEADMPSGLIKPLYMIVDGTKEIPRYRFWDDEEGEYAFGGGFYVEGGKLKLMFTFSGDAEVTGYWTPTETQAETKPDFLEAVLALAASKAFSKMGTAIAREKDISMEGIPDIKDASLKFTQLARDKYTYAMGVLKKTYAVSR